MRTAPPALRRATPGGLLLLVALGLPAVVSAAPLSTGGPDSYGYSYVDSAGSGGPAYDSSVFTMASILGTELTTADSSDDSSEAVTLPFNFSFYGTNYTTVWVCANGYLTFTTGCSFSNTSLSTNSNTMIAPFWDDMDNRGAGTSYIYAYTTGTAPNRVFNVVYIDVTHYQYSTGYGNVSFAVQLTETSNDITFHFKDLLFEFGGSSYSAGLSATTGIDAGTTTGYDLEYNSFAAQIVDGTAVRFSTAPVSTTLTAEANGPYTANEGVASTISAAGSTTTGATLSYDCTSDGTYEITGSSATSYPCTYPDQGTYTATVRATKTSTGTTVTDSATVTVANVAPSYSAWSFSGDYSYATGSSGTYTTATVTAYEGDTVTVIGTATDVAADTVTVTNTWGDGTSSSDYSAVSQTHAYTDEGTYTLTTIARDEDGGSTNFTTATGMIVYYAVANASPVITTSSTTAGSEKAVTSFSGAATDAGTSDVLSYAWTYGDGSTSSSASNTHQYRDEGTYNWTLTVTDGDGGSDIASGTVTVANTPPTISSASVGSASEGSPLTVTAAATAGLYDTVTYAWDFGDGSTGTGASTTHVYSTAGTYVVTLTVTDDDGASVTWSGSAVVSNYAPTISSLTVGSAMEGSPLTVSAVATDAGGAALTYTWSFGDGTSTTTSTASTTHAYTDEGSYTVAVTVTDPSGGSATTSGTATVTNASPNFSAVTIPSTGSEGTAISVSASGTDAGTADILSYTWDWGDGTSSTGATASHAYVNDGVYMVSVTVTDGDGGSASASGSTTIRGVAPTISAYSAPSPVYEATSTTFSATGVDAGTADTLTYAWSWGDGSASSSGPTVTHSWADDGLYTVSLTVADEDGLSSTTTFGVTVTNLSPSISTVYVGSPAEGIPQALSALVTDVGTLDTFTYSWDFGDGTTGTGATPSHDWPDDGSYSVTLLVTDDDGGTDSAVVTVTVSNVDPVIASSPSLTAAEGVAWTYTPSVADVAADPPTFSLTDAPATMTVDVGSGALSWTPTWEDAVSPVHVTLSVDDGDGGRGSQSFDITVTAIDTDGDGIPDGYEDLYGLDKTDAADALTDLDLDGASNLEEYEAGTDPGSYDGPTAPILVAPIAGAVTSQLRPSLQWSDAESPRGLVLTYDVEVYADASMASLLASTTEELDVSGDQTWTVDVALPDNTICYWRARANDGIVDGDWTDLEDFEVNTAEEPPTIPVLVQPVGGDVATSLNPTLQWTLSTDPDGTAVTYDVKVWDKDGVVLVTFVNDLADDGVDLYGEWPVDLTLAEDTFYSWTARAVDATGNTSDWAEPELFHVSTTNAAPSDVAWISPVEGESLASLTPALSWSASVDPEGTSPVYEVQGDVDPGFAAAFSATATDPSLDLSTTGYSLVENTVNYLRVRAEDADGVPSAWAVVSVFARGENDAPTAPTLVSLEDGSVEEPGPITLRFGEATDPDLDALTYEVYVSTSADMAGAQSSGPLTLTDGQGTWDVELEAGTWYWTASATDPDGATTAAAVWSFTLGDPDDTGLTGDDTGGANADGGDGKGGCGCASTSGSGAGLLALAGLLAATRRRSRR